jgi:hypothetical protein
MKKLIKDLKKDLKRDYELEVLHCEECKHNRYVTNPQNPCEVFGILPNVVKNGNPCVVFKPGKGGSKKATPKIYTRKSKL